MNETSAVRALTVAQWAELVQNGATLRVNTRLDGTSMQPLLRKERDIVTIAAVNRALKRGDIVLFRRSDGAYVVHRIRRFCGDSVITLGDNCWKEDVPICRDAVLGIAVQAQRGKCTICLDSCLSRAWGRCWMACHGGRILYRRARGAIIRRAKRVLKWKRD